MKVSFGLPTTLPEKFQPGKIYFVKEEGAIYVAISETDVVQYSNYKDLEKINNAQQNIIEDLETIRDNAEVGANMAKNISVINNEDIDTLFENLN